jgi:hypothetical protein
MPAQRCCRSCPRCHDCPVLVAAAARTRHRGAPADNVASLVDQVFAGVGLRRTLPDSVTRTLASLDAARRGGAFAGTAS